MMKEQFSTDEMRRSPEAEQDPESHTDRPAKGLEALSDNEIEQVSGGLAKRKKKDEAARKRKW